MRTGLRIVVAGLLMAVTAFGQEPGPTPVPGKPEPPAERPEEELVRLDPDFPHFAFIEDPGPFIHRGNPITDARRGAAAESELKAYDYVLSFAKRQPVERMRKFSVKGVNVEDLFRPIRRDYLRELIYMEGKLALVSAMKPTENLKKLDGIDQLYEVWLFVRDSSKLVCVVVSELPEGVRPGKEFDQWVAFDAYYFKLFHYESKREKAEGKNQWESAPLFLGKTVEVIPSPPPPDASYRPSMLIAIVGGLGGLGLLGFVLTMWFRKGDARIRAGAREKIDSFAKFDDVP